MQAKFGPIVTACRPAARRRGPCTIDHLMQNMILCTFLIGCGLSKHNYYTDHCSVIRLIKEDGWDLGQEYNDYCMHT